jgi:hypothetical protein
MRLTGHYKIESDAFDEFAQSTIDDVLGLYREAQVNWTPEPPSAVFKARRRLES